MIWQFEKCFFDNFKVFMDGRTWSKDDQWQGIGSSISNGWTELVDIYNLYYIFVVWRGDAQLELLS